MGASDILYDLFLLPRWILTPLKHIFVHPTLDQDGSPQDSYRSH